MGWAADLLLFNKLRFGFPFLICPPEESGVDGVELIANFGGEGENGHAEGRNRRVNNFNKGEPSGLGKLLCFPSLYLPRDLCNDVLKVKAFRSIKGEGGSETTSKRLADRKVERFQKNITKRGAVPETTTKKGTDYPVGPILLGFFVFVVIGSSLFQIIRTATSGGMA
ncbi:hypothetical protein GIB67_009364 [Kingdonia uniflora]|uniref:Stress-associated endoplasmic reticulum protein n=1 Tax=Kingdonia uniflora TaxID=39325 RepID=A0A7J7N2W0_9MAGN|nr:hypothetical protein GIB67_009364 [Kingdonia uniflora]